MAGQTPEPAGLTRREFFTVSAGSLLVASMDAAALEEPPWYATMRRCGQINFNERDPLTMDADAWMGYWASLKVNAVLLNGGGIVAFYPTEVPFHHRSRFLGSRPPFGEMVAAATKRHNRVVARMDFQLGWGEDLRAHSAKLERDRDSSPRP